MSTLTVDKKIEKSMLEQLAERVQDLFLKVQSARSMDRPRASVLYGEACLAYRAHKIFVIEQDALLK
ncbi:MAG: hypothetical protein JNL01_10090 [Bdellovibrionales bacterium]|nr:hypothetical protein [Bdellovibrionales bacterium]